MNDISGEGWSIVSITPHSDGSKTVTYSLGPAVRRIVTVARSDNQEDAIRRTGQILYDLEGKP